MRTVIVNIFGLVTVIFIFKTAVIITLKITNIFANTSRCKDKSREKKIDLKRRELFSDSTLRKCILSQTIQRFPCVWSSLLFVHVFIVTIVVFLFV